MKNILLTGRPKAGKTTLLKKIVPRLKCEANGFFITALYENSKRVGFKLRTLQGKEGILAHESINSAKFIGRFSVDVDLLERLGVESIEKGMREDTMIIIDEIGKLCLFSDRFKFAVLYALDSLQQVIGTISSYSAPFVNEIKMRHDVELIPVNRENRKYLANTILDMIDGKS